jgi:hypothetical protein
MAAPFLFDVTGRNGGTPPARDQPAPPGDSDWLHRRFASFETVRRHAPADLLRMTSVYDGIKKERHPEEPAQRASRRTRERFSSADQQIEACSSY